METPASRSVSIAILSKIELKETVKSGVDAGQAVLWIRSTVTDAISDFTAFEASGVSCLLHHGRFALQDRTWLDQQLTGIFGPNGKKRGIVAVTTQTAEQSLDIDADTLVTDACPADVLIQRLGRLHRHRTGTKPHAYMTDPGKLDRYLTEDGRTKGLEGQGWAFVYQNLLSVKETLDWIRERGQICVPEESRGLVELATNKDHLKDSADREALVLDDLTTRFGIGSLTVSTPGLKSPFTSHEIDALSIPLKWFRPTTSD